MACFRVNFTITFYLSTKRDCITTTTTTATTWSQLSAVVLCERGVIPCFADSKGL